MLHQALLNSVLGVNLEDLHRRAKLELFGSVLEGNLGDLHDAPHCTPHGRVTRRQNHDGHKPVNFVTYLAQPVRFRRKLMLTSNTDAAPIGSLGNIALCVWCVVCVCGVVWCCTCVVRVNMCAATILSIIQRIRHSNNKTEHNIPHAARTRDATHRPQHSDQRVVDTEADSNPQWSS